ncbi:MULTISPECIES: AMP-binding protein [unclassified Bosea (in: a-proteobacteria)]|uniref:AMP-binding protein n=1 Tax=unclassified Bosea (in: a-proteobacteria) TaxID=2653178 RepID=UPI0009548A42|nr:MULTISPECIES: AMP-binding protein [unclassified Bosea (in: a-proteobacteria)]TAJ28731.1 MAG: AMP-dependent synthetase [Bosea sp. (in: a-proteobacteria)]SIR24135.1 acetyl-CoA synthetase [Bosea sp. TND4EK4]
MHLPRLPDYAALRAAFRWHIPERYNIAVDVCDRWAALEPQRPAIIEVSRDWQVHPVSFGWLREQSNRLADALGKRGVRRGERLAILLPQGRHVLTAHLAAYKLGAVAVPLAALFGVDALAYRLADSGAKAIVTDDAGLAKLRQIPELPAGLELVVSIDGADGGIMGWDTLVEEGSADFVPAETGPDDPALMIYTSGTTGNPKGALHGHRVLPGHLPGVQMPHEFMPQPGDRAWTPADWAWAGGLLNMLLPALHFGVAVVARPVTRFEPDEAYRLMQDLAIRNAFVPPTALRMLRGAGSPRDRFRLNLRTVAAAGEALGAETLEWGREALGLTINEAYGQTECNLVLASCAGIGISRPGCIGKAVPGHEVAIIRPDGSVCEPGEEGQIAVRRPDPVMFLGYWNNPAATAAKFVGDWMITGDEGVQDEDGYVRFIGRDDDIITSSGYRIGPGEIEDCLLKHPEVALAAVVGKPDALRTEIVKAFVVPRDGGPGSPELAAELQAFVKARLSAHEYPREIAFREELPMTTTGKIIRRQLRAEA